MFEKIIENRQNRRRQSAYANRYKGYIDPVTDVANVHGDFEGFVKAIQRYIATGGKPDDAEGAIQTAESGSEASTDTSLPTELA